MGEDMAEEDKKTKERIDAKNAFDGYIHSMRSAIEGSGGLGDKLEADEKSSVMDAVKEGQSWMDSNPEADVEEIKQKEQEIKDICAPTMAKAVVEEVATTHRMVVMRASTMSSDSSISSS